MANATLSAAMDAFLVTATDELARVELGVVSNGSLTYTDANTPAATDASTRGIAAVLSMTLTGNWNLLVPTGGLIGQRISYLLKASGGARTVTPNASIEIPTSVTYDGAIASGNTRLITLAYTGAVWLMVENLEFTLP